MLELVIKALREGRIRSAERSIAAPNTDHHPAYMYGLVIGKQQGWQEALDAVNAALSEASKERNKT